MMESLTYAAGPAVVIGGLMLVIWQGIRIGRTGQMTDVSTGADGIEIRPRWPLPLLAFRFRIVIPIDKIADVTVEPQARDYHPLTLRLMGIAIPGALTAGTFRGADGTSFWLYGTGRNALTIATRDFRYQLLVIETAKPRDAARDLRAILHPPAR